MDILNCRVRGLVAVNGAGVPYQAEPPSAALTDETHVSAPRRESGSSRGASRDLQRDVDTTEAGIPTLEMACQTAVNDLGADLNQQVGTLA